MILGAEVCGNRGRRAVPMVESAADLIAHRCRDVSVGVENAPDIDELVADDVEHEIRKTSQRSDTEMRNLEFVGESQAARVR